MNKDKSTAIIYRDWSSIVLGLTPEKAGELFQGLFRRWADEPDGLDPTLKVILDYFETKIDENNAKHEEASQKRAEGRRKQAEELKALKDTSSNLKSIKKTSKNLTSLKRPDTDTDTDTVTDTDTETERYVSLAALPPLSPKDEAELRQIVGDRADALIEDVRAYYSTHTGFPGWPIALAQFDRNQKRWGLAKAQTAKSTADIMKMAFPEGVEQ